MWKIIRNEQRMYRKGRSYVRGAWESAPYGAREGFVLIPRKTGKHMAAGSVSGAIWVSRGFCRMIAVCRTVENAARREDMRLAEHVFLQTAGHEIALARGGGRQKKQKRVFPSKKDSFFDRVNEVHADFAGASLFSLPVEEVVMAMKFRKGLDGNAHTSSRPSWSQRIRYISTGKYDADLVRMIAGDIGFADEDAIAGASALYPDIILEDAPPTGGGGQDSPDGEPGEAKRSQAQPDTRKVCRTSPEGELDTGPVQDMDSGEKKGN